MRHRCLRWIPLFALAAACGAPTLVDDAGSACDPSLSECAHSACAADSCPAGERCVEESGGAFRCECPPGSVRSGETCAVSPVCIDSSCDHHGLCSDGTGEVACECDLGYAGPHCESCDEGYQRNADGLCVTNLCEPNPCTEDAERGRCEVREGAVVCECNAGTHDEEGSCVPDETCLPSTCSGRGICRETAEGVQCECNAGSIGSACEQCDLAMGYHSDGMGGCTSDACVPSPCTRALETVCVVDPDGAARCECDEGAHREGEACVRDEVCASDTCANGTCNVVDGRAQCTCPSGYTGARCEVCAEGFHDDGSGGCTDDACLPSPCTTIAHRTVCTDDGGSAVCSCEPGWHDDLVGGCTNDPCRPDPCTASGQVCRVVGGEAECFTPVCDDHNPCTNDVLVAGACMYAPLPNGTACSTSLCQRGQSCQAGSCGGGTPVTCDDANPCTRDACDPAAGCVAQNDDALVPNDGIACTTDACSGGAAAHTPSDRVCDDGVWCDGAERCGSSGCIEGAAPAPPGPSTACRSYVCDEASDSFRRIDLAVGASCDDGISCTSGDVCTASGTCAGAPLATCPFGLACASTTTFAPMSVDVPVARVTGAITLDGAALPSATSDPPGGFSLFLVSRETEQRHYIASPRYDGGFGSPYTLVGGSVDALLVPGVYDLVYSRCHDAGSTTSWPVVSRQPTSAQSPCGYVVLREDIVIARGAQTLNVDVPVSRVTGAITLDGAALPTTSSNPPGGFSLFLVSRETEQRHYIASPRYDGGFGSPYTLVGGSVDALLVPGVYDLVYSRCHDAGSTTSWPVVSRQTTSAQSPCGYVVLREDISIARGAQTLNVDVPVSRVTGTITLDGAALPTTTSDPPGGFSLFLVSRETEQRHYIASPRYDGGFGSPYTLVGGSVDALLVPGVYDLVYSRCHDAGSTTSWPVVSRQPTSAQSPCGYVVLREDIVIARGAQTLNVDVPVSRVTGAITLDGAALPTTTSNPPGGFSLFLVSRETEQRHYIASPRYDGGFGSPYTLVGGSVDALLVPGTYDLVYSRCHDAGSTTSWPVVSRQPTSAQSPCGYVVLREDIAIGRGAQTLNVDVPVSRVTGTITLDGVALPTTTSDPPGGFSLFLVSRETEQRHYIASPRYDGGFGSPYTLVGGSVDALLVPGVYDLVYSRCHDAGSTTSWPVVSRQPTSAQSPCGYVVLREDIAIGSGAQTLNVDVPVAPLTAAITLDGAPLPTTTSNPPGGFSLFLVSRETEQRHYVASPRYDGGFGSPYTLVNGSVDALLVPGVYDLVYSRCHDAGSSTSWPVVSRQPTDGQSPCSHVVLQSCLAIR